MKTHGTIMKNAAQKVTRERLVSISAMIQAGQLDRAQSALKSELKSSPKLAVLHSLQGQIAWQRNQYQQALTSFLQATKLEPRNHEAFKNVGALYAQMNDKENAEKYYLISLKLNPNYTEALSGLAALKEEMDEVDEALKLYRDCLKINSRNASVHASLLDLLDSLNRTEEFDEQLKQSKKAIPASAVINLYAGIGLARKKRYEESREMLRAINFGRPPHVNPVLETRRQFQLGSVLDKTGDYKSAFKFFQSAKSRLNAVAKSKGYDGALYIAMAAELLGYMHSRQFENWQNIHQFEHKSPTFLIGFPRSGTTLLDTVLRSHEGVIVREELPAVRNMRTEFSKMSDDPARLFDNLTADQSQKLRKLYFDILDFDPKVDDRILIDKLPLNITQLPLILRIFPDAKFILAIRHPVDSVLSNFMQNFRQNSAMSVMNDFRTAAQLYDVVMRIWEASLPLIEDRFVIVRYEDLIEDLRSTVEPVLEMIGLDWRENLYEYQSTALARSRIRTPSFSQVVQPLYKESSGRWRNYRTQLAPILPLLEPWAVRFGYGPLGD